MSKYQAIDNDHVGRGVVKVERISDQTVPNQPGLKAHATRSKIG